MDEGRGEVRGVVGYAWALVTYSKAAPECVDQVVREVSVGVSLKVVM